MIKQVHKIYYSLDWVCSNTCAVSFTDSIYHHLRVKAPKGITEGSLVKIQNHKKKRCRCSSGCARLSCGLH